MWLFTVNILSSFIFMYLYIFSMEIATKTTVNPHILSQHRKSGHRISRQGPKVWDKWSAWSGCSVTCGIGKLSRWRHCIAGGCSPGEKQQQLTTCTFASCLYEGGKSKSWDQWSKWSCCSASCGEGKITRWRHCIGGGCAPGEKEAQIKHCFLTNCINDDDSPEI